jgi:hypothetical protein
MPPFAAGARLGVSTPARRDCFIWTISFVWQP